MSNCYICGQEESKRLPTILRECPTCGVLLCPNCNSSGYCPECKSSLIANMNLGAGVHESLFEVKSGNQQSTKRMMLIGFIIVLLSTTVWFFGSYHIVSSSAAGTMIVPKVVFSFNETFVSVDEITGMPFISAKSKYPLAVKALQRKGVLETDEKFDARIRAGVQAEMEKAQREAEREMQKSMKQLGY